MVADSDVEDTLADLLDDARALVTPDQRVVAGQVPGAGVVVGVTEPGRGELDEHFAGLRRVELELDDVPRLSGFPHDCSTGLHETSRHQNQIRLLGRYLA